MDQKILLIPGGVIREQKTISKLKENLVKDNFIVIGYTIRIEVDMYHETLLDSLKEQEDNISWLKQNKISCQAIYNISSEGNLIWEISESQNYSNLFYSQKIENIDEIQPLAILVEFILGHYNFLSKDCILIRHQRINDEISKRWLTISYNDFIDNTDLNLSLLNLGYEEDKNLSLISNNWVAHKQFIQHLKEYFIQSGQSSLKDIKKRINEKKEDKCFLKALIKEIEKEKFRYKYLQKRAKEINFDIVNFKTQQDSELEKRILESIISFLFKIDNTNRANIQNRYDEIFKLFDISPVREDPLLIFEIADMHGDWDLAISNLSEVINKISDTSNLLWNKAKAYFYRARSYERKGFLTKQYKSQNYKSHELFEKALDDLDILERPLYSSYLNITFSQIYALKGNIYLNLKNLEKNLEKAKECYEKVIQRDKKIGSPQYFSRGAYNGMGNSFRTEARKKIKNYSSNSGKINNCYRKAIFYYEIAINISDDYWRPRRNKSVVLIELENYEYAIDEINQAIGILINKKKTAKKAYHIAGCDEGLANINYSLAKFYEEKKKSFPEASLKYKECLEFFEKLPNGMKKGNRKRYFESLYKYLENLEKFISDVKVYNYNYSFNELQKLIDEGAFVLNKYLRCSGEMWLGMKSKEIENKKLKLARTFASFDHLIVDQLFRDGRYINALLEAERRRNIGLQWIKKQKWEQRSENYIGDKEIQKFKKLLPKNSAIIYWNVSILSVTTFVLFSGDDELNYLPIIEGEDFIEWKNWIKKMINNNPAVIDEFTETSRGKTKGQWKDLQHKLIKKRNNTWLEEMPTELQNLSKILHFDKLKEQLENENIDYIVLIPHLELHLIPLHYIFWECIHLDCYISYLPSISMGIELFNRINPKKSHIDNILICMGDKQGEKHQLEEIEKEVSILQKLYHPNCEILNFSNQENKIKLTNNMRNDNNKCFAFIGHAKHNPIEPWLSYLKLSEYCQLSLEDILLIETLEYDLVCLSACETGVVGEAGLNDEYVGLSSGFLAQGSTSVLNTLWSIEDAHSAIFMVILHSLINPMNAKAKAMNPIEALNKVQKLFRSNDKTTLIAILNKLIEHLNIEIKSLDIQKSNLTQDCPKSKKKLLKEKLKLKDFRRNLEAFIDFASNQQKFFPNSAKNWAGFNIIGVVSSLKT